MQIKINKTTLEITDKKFYDIKSDSLIFPANNYLWMGNDLSSIVKKHAGDNVEKLALEYGSVEIGKTVTTENGDLPTTHLIHAVCMGQDGKISLNDIKTSLNNALNEAKEWDSKKVLVLPFINQTTGPSPYETAETMLNVCIDHCMGKTTISHIIFSTDTDQIETIFNDTLSKIFSFKRKK